MHIKKNIVLQREDNKPILIDIFYNERFKNQPVVIFCHGYKGFKDWGAWDIMAKLIANAGYVFVKFNFSHNGGTVEQPIDFSDLDAFGNNNYTKELNDLGDVIDWITITFKEKPFVNTSQITLIGHSRGGGISILKSAEDTRVSKLITLASVCDFGRRSATVGDLEKWQNEGVKYVRNGRTKQDMPHYFQFYEDYQLNKERLDIKKASQAIRIPHLIIHGNKDTSVNISEAESISKWSTQGRLEIINEADHVFNIKHPWVREDITPQFNNCINKIIRFLNMKH